VVVEVAGGGVIVCGMIHADCSGGGLGVMLTVGAVAGAHRDGESAATCRYSGIIRGDRREHKTYPVSPESSWRVKGYTELVLERGVGSRGTAPAVTVPPGALAWRRWFAAG